MRDTYRMNVLYKVDENNRTTSYKQNFIVQPKLKRHRFGNEYVVTPTDPTVEESNESKRKLVRQ